MLDMRRREFITTIELHNLLLEAEQLIAERGKANTTGAEG